MTRHEGNGTFDAILDRSLQLFNDSGIESVPIQRVAASLGISPGNLTYHFKRKSHLVDALLNRLEGQLLIGLRDFPYTAGAWSFVQAYARLFVIAWQHRALFNGAPYLIQSGLVPAVRFATLSTQITATMTSQTQHLIRQGFMDKVRAPYDVKMLIECVWWQWLGWLRDNQVRDATDPLPVEDIVRSGIHHSILLVLPYMRKDYPAKLHQAVEELDLRELNSQPADRPRTARRRSDTADKA